MRFEQALRRNVKKRSSASGAVGRMSAASASTATWIFHPYLEEAATALQHFAVQRGLRGSGFVAFHLDETESLALTGEDIMREVDGTHGAELIEKGANVFFPGLGGQIADE
jgi:hypothetical protein